MKKSIYLDYAAATPLDADVLKAMEPYFADDFHNPSAIYLAGRKARLALEQARAAVAKHLGARTGEIVFTAGATEANNLAVQGVMKNFDGGEILVSAIEHESVLAPAGLFNCRHVPVDKKGRLSLDKLAKLINDNTVLVSVGLVNNEIGSLQPLREIAQILKRVSNSRGSRGLPLYLHTDAAQAANYFDLHVSRLGVDLMTINGGKIYGPKQTGVLYIRTGVKLQPLILGGGQESGLRSGTENVAGAMGLAKALDRAQQLKQEENQRVGRLRDLFIAELAAKFPKAIINSVSKNQSPHILSVTFPGTDNERLMMELDEAGVQVAVGSACSASSQEPSHVLKAIGLSNAQAQATLRFSFGRQTTEENIIKTLNILQAILNKSSD